MCTTFGDDRLMDLGVAMGRISRFAIDLRRRPYNTLALPCECVISTFRCSIRFQSAKCLCIHCLPCLSQSDSGTQPPGLLGSRLTDVNLVPGQRVLE